MTSTVERPTRRSEEQRPRHGPVAQLLLAWAPLSGILLAYVLAQWLNAPLSDTDDPGGTNRLGVPLHVAGPAHADRALFGTVPSVWLQQHWLHDTARWYDAVAAVTWISHFVSIPLVTALVWFRVRDRFGSWIVAVTAFTVVGVSGYVVYPAAPPWLASEQGRIGAVHRVSDLGWQWLGLDPLARLSALAQGESNPVAAMPSLHAGAALLVAGFAWPLVRRRWRPLLAAYVVLMALVLVYSGEHYVVDVLAGWGVAALGLLAGAGWRRRREPGRDLRPGTP